MVGIASILHLVPQYLHDVEDYLSLTSVDQATRNIIEEDTTPHTLLLLCYQSRRTFFRPDPSFLLSTLARSLSIWASRSTENLRRLIHSFWSGEEAVLDLAISVPAVAIEARWSLAKVRELWEWRMRVVNPLTDLLDKCVGKQWYDVPDFWDGGREDAVTLYAEPDETVFRMIIYGELFGRGWDEWTEKGGQTDHTVRPYASIPTHLEFVKYLLPDWHSLDLASDGATGGIHRGLEIECSRPYLDGEIVMPSRKVVHAVTSHTRIIHPYRAIQKEVGPYAGKEPDSEFQSVLLHLFTSSILWRQVTSKVRELCGGDFSDPDKFIWVSGDGWWRQELWENALYMLGNEGMEMVMQVWKVIKAESGDELEQTGPGWEKLRRYRRVIAELEAEPQRVNIGAGFTYEPPHFVRDLTVISSDR